MIEWSLINLVLNINHTYNRLWKVSFTHTLDNKHFSVLSQPHVVEVEAFFPLFDFVYCCFLAKNNKSESVHFHLAHSVFEHQYLFDFTEAWVSVLSCLFSNFSYTANELFAVGSVHVAETFLGGNSSFFQQVLPDFVAGGEVASTIIEYRSHSFVVSYLSEARSVFLSLVYFTTLHVMLVKQASISNHAWLIHQVKNQLAPTLLVPTVVDSLVPIRMRVIDDSVEVKLHSIVVHNHGPSRRIELNVRCVGWGLPMICCFE